MEVRTKIFKISYVTLLSDVTKSLGFSNPIYGQLEELNNMTYVIVRTTAISHAYFFDVKQCGNLMESKEDVAEKAIRSLAKKYKLGIEEINLEKKERFDNCSAFYKTLRASLENVEIDQNSLPAKFTEKRGVDDYLKSISINYKDLLAHILDEFGIGVTKIDSRNLDTGGYVCCFGIKDQKDEYTMEWIMGERCETVDAAHQSLVKKAILYLKPLYNFEIKDINYNEMFFGDAICALDRERYIEAKEKHVLTKEHIKTPLITSSLKCAAPKGPEFQIPFHSNPPPPPKKRKVYRRGSTATMLANAISIEDDVTVTYKVHDSK